MDLAPYTWIVVDVLASLTLTSHALIVALGILLIRDHMNGTLSSITRFFSRNVLVLAFIVAAVAVSGSLYMSEIAGWAPCKYCWLQRIFMYPQLILLAIALWKNDRGIAPYIFSLSVPGVLLAGYHYYIQMHHLLASPDNPATPCDTSGESCVTTPFTELGYITVPMMSLTAFALLLLGSVLLKKRP